MDEQYRRKPQLWCGQCRRPHADLVYLNDGGHYCWDCAEYQHRTFGYEAAGHRAEDLDPWDQEGTPLPSEAGPDGARIIPTMPQSRNVDPGGAT